MYESDCSQAGDWNCISPGYEALINILSGKERMRTKVECGWLYEGTIKGFPQACGHIEGNLSGPKVIIIIIIIIIIIYLSWSWAICWPVPVSRIQKSLQRSAMIPSASWGIAFHYPG
jgi:hypothetical protein